MNTTSIAIVPRALAAGVLTAFAHAQAPPSNGPALGIPTALNTRDAQGNPTGQLRFKLPGLQNTDPVAVETTGGPEALATSPEALGWSGPAWQQVPGASPGPMSRHLMVTHPSQPGLAMLRGNGLMWTRTGGTWSAATVWPHYRENAGVALDTARQVVVLFGGHLNPSHLPDGTWEWDGSTWTETFPATAPAMREDLAMAYDSARDVTVLFGGFASGLGGSLNDTWEYDGTNWVQVATVAAPPPRFRHQIAYDEARARIVLFGGSDTGSVLGDTWEYDGSNWLQRNPVNSPSPRHSYALTYDPLRQRVLLNGGALNLALGTTATTADTFAWDGNDWCELQRTPSMTTRADHAMAFDSATGEVVLHGGIDPPSVVLGDTWSLDQTQHPLPINDFSLGLDWIPASDTDAGQIHVPPLSWIGMTFALRDGASGQTNSRISMETDGVGSDLFSYVFHGSDQACLPGHQVGDVWRAANSDEGIVGTGTVHEINGIDVFLPAYHNGPNYTGHELPANPSIYFTIARDGIDRVPTSWWSGGQPSAATILVSDWNGSAWSCPRVWIHHHDIEIPDPMSMTGFSPLSADEEIDSLAVGRNDGVDGPPTFVLLSTNRSLSNGSPTKAPDQLMVSSPGDLDGALTSLVLRVFLTSQLERVSDKLGLNQGDDLGPCSTHDPCTLTATPVTGRNYFRRRFAAYADPAVSLPFLATIPFGDGTVYRSNNGSDQLVAIATRPNGLGATLWLSPDPNNPGLGAFPLLATPMVGDHAEVVIPLGPAMLGTRMLHWLTLDTSFHLERSSVVFDF